MRQYFDSRYTGLCVHNNMVYVVKLGVRSNFWEINPHIYNITMIHDLVSEHSCVTPIVSTVRRSGELSYYGGSWLYMNKEQFNVELGDSKL